MAKYTTEVRTICEVNAGAKDRVDRLGVNKTIEASREKIFDFEYPIFDESYRPVLETKILKHYYTREIAFETVGLWKLKLETKLNEIMPMYNQRYKSALLNFNPLYDTDYQKTIDDNKTDSETRKDNTTDTKNVTSNVDKDNTVEESSFSHGTQNTTQETNNTNLYNDTPQGGLSGIDSMTYLTSVTKDNGSSNGENVTDKNGGGATTESGTVDYKEDTKVINEKIGLVNATSIGEYLEHVSGKMNGSKTYSQMLNEYRQSFINVDMEVINDLWDLFFTLY